MFGTLSVLTMCILTGCGPTPEPTSATHSDSKVINPIKKKLLSNINFFIETSGSMKGYMSPTSGATEFQQLLPDFLRRINDETVLNSYSIFDSKSIFKKENFRLLVESKIPKGGFSWSGDTYIPTIIDSIGKYLSPNSVNVFVSDCIYSPEPGNAGNTAQEISQIRSVFNPVAKNFATSIFSLKSKFYHKGRPVVLSPYYLILQGNPDNLAAVRKMLLQSIATFSQSFSEINFGFPYFQPYYSILPYTEASGSFIGDKNLKANNYESISDVEFIKGTANQFWLALDLSSYPLFASDTTYLNNNLSLVCDNGTAKIIVIKSALSSVKQNEQGIAQRCSTYLRIEFSEFYKPIDNIKLSLKSTNPRWISLLNSDDLSTSESNRTLTYGLSNIITGIDQAYNKDGVAKYFIKDLQFQLKRKD